MTNNESQTEASYEGDTYDSPSIRDDDISSSHPERSNDDEDPDAHSSLLDSPSVAGNQSTPRVPSTTKAQRTKSEAPTFADYSSPYESLKSQVEHSPEAKDSKQPQPITPGKNRVAFPDTSMTPTSSPAELPSTYLPSAPRRANNDTLLHRVLDKTYRIQATPHTQREARRPAGSRPRGPAETPVTATKTAASRFLDSSPLDSSPGEQAPQLRPEIFSSPMKGARTPRTPGVSVQTPAAKRNIASARRQTEFGARNKAGEVKGEGDGWERSLKTKTTAWDSDSDDDFADGLEDMSPPKTMQFVVPQGRLLQTPGTFKYLGYAQQREGVLTSPLLRTAGTDLLADLFPSKAREASKRIVEDLLLTAGGDITDEMAPDEDSPSVIRRNEELDDSF